MSAAPSYCSLLAFPKPGHQTQSFQRHLQLSSLLPLWIPLRQSRSNSTLSAHLNRTLIPLTNLLPLSHTPFHGHRFHILTHGHPCLELPTFPNPLICGTNVHCDMFILPLFSSKVSHAHSTFSPCKSGVKFLSPGQ